MDLEHIGPIKIIEIGISRLVNIRLYFWLVVQRSLFLVLALGFAGLLAIGSFELGLAQTIETVDVVENKLVTLIGQGFDPDAEDLAFLWEQLDGEPMQLSSYNFQHLSLWPQKLQMDDQSLNIQTYCNRSIWCTKF